MNLLRNILILVSLFLIIGKAIAQYPQYFPYDDENGLPSNEVYSIVQDEKGFIWFGCDAGLFKYNGVRYTLYKCKTQKSKSITGLTISTSGKLYCYNFQSQLFCIENDTLKELKHLPYPITSITSDQHNNIWITHEQGLSQYNETNSTWKTYTNFGTKNNFWTQHFTSSVKITPQNKVCFLNTEGVGIMQKEQLKIIPNEDFKHIAPGRFIMANLNEKLFVFSIDGSPIYELENEILTKCKSENLVRILENKKITNAQTLSDGCLWICTYNGVVRFNPHINVVDLLYPSFSFSNVLIDREKNYWFTTLQTGILRVPNLNFLTWNTSTNELLKNDKTIKITNDKTHIFFATVNGYIGQLNSETYQLKTFHTGSNADIQSLKHIQQDKQTYFYTGKNLYSLKNDRIELVLKEIFPIKSLSKVQDDYFLASSRGLFIHSFDKKWTGNRTATVWCREIIFDSLHHSVYAATNNGIIQYKKQNNQWIESHKFLTDIQMQSSDFSDHKLYTVSFDGKIYEIDSTKTIKNIATLPENAQASKIKYYNQVLYIATNKGIWIYNLKQKNWTTLNRLSGLASDNVQDLTILNNAFWIATGKGLQKIPLEENIEKPLAKVYLKNLDHKTQLKYGYPLRLYPEASIYKANGNFKYVYRVNQNEWISLPASIQLIEIQNLPAGELKIELKTIDHLDRDSENTIVLHVFVQPPFWQTWWFMIFIIVLIGIFIFLLVKNVITNIKKREHERNELLNSQLKAIRAQMNPHFMYNTLNSIQDLILQQDIKSTNYYLSRFSSLMRQVLAFSEEEKVLLAEEKEMLQNYLELEKLRFGDDFSFTIHIDETIDIQRVFIPSLIIQPFVENAIKHGLLHKKGDKILNIIFSLKNNLLQILVEDNGVGRKRSTEIKERSGLKHQSFSTNAVQKRIELLNKIAKFQINIEIEDISKEENNTGTRVIITVENFYL